MMMNLRPSSDLSMRTKALLILCILIVAFANAATCDGLHSTVTQFIYFFFYL